jgi:hypothetical protein
MVPPIRNDTNGMGLISMGDRDVKRIQVLAEVRAGKRTVVSAAAVLDLGCGRDSASCRDTRQAALVR